MNESQEGTSANPARSRIITRSRLTSKNRITIPVEVRKALKLKPGDTIIFEESVPGMIGIRKAEPLDLEFVSALENTLSEWDGDTDDRAYQDL
jgi:antitoxin PrlF